MAESTVPPDRVLVVGAGAAGMALALDLANRGQHVVLLESGPDAGDDADATALAAAGLNEGVVSGLPFGLDGRARGLGGTTGLWHGQCMRMHHLDLQERAWVPHSGWPLSSEQLDGYYPAAERWLGVSGGDYGKSRWDSHPDLPPLQWNTERLLHDFTEYTPQPHLVKLYGDALRKHPLVLTIVNATVGKVLVENGVAAGVEVHSTSGVCTLRSRRIALTAGAIENARLLQLSDPAGVGLGTGRQHTGRFLQTHPVINMARVHPHDHRVLSERYILLRTGRQRRFPKVRLAPDGQAQHQLLDATAVFLHEYDHAGFLASRRLLESVKTRRLPDHLVRDVFVSAKQAGPQVRDLYRRYARKKATAVRPSAIFLQMWLEQQPDPDSRLDLAVTRDSLGLRQVRVRWKLGEPERRTSRVMTRWIADDLARLGLARTEELPPMSDDAAWTSAVRDAAHPSGTTRMSIDGNTGVVDADLQVHGVRGLYVVGSSVFPIAGYANPTLTIVALALRLSDRLVSHAQM